MRVVAAIVVWLALVAHTRGQMDQDFCQSHTYPKKTDFKTPPLFSADYTVSTEYNDYDGSDVSYQTTYYSTTNQFMKLDNRAPGLRTITYAFPKRDSYRTWSTSITDYGEINESCVAEPLERSMFAAQYAMTEDSEHGLRLPIQNLFLLSSSAHTTLYYVRDETVRGIPTTRWHTCAYQDWTKSTISAEVYYTSSKMAMFGSPAEVPIKLTTFIKDKNGKISKMRYDFYSFSRNVDMRDKNLEMPWYLQCRNAVTANPDMPSPPDHFHFEGIVNIMGDIGRINRETPKLLYAAETFDDGYRVNSVEIDAPGDQYITKFRKKIVHDFNTGLEYSINLSSGVCNVTDIKTATGDFHQVAFGSVAMNNPKDVFDMRKYNYQYIGKHTHFDRDIEADVYTSTDKNGTTMRTFWFASKSFLKKIGYKDSYLPLRQRMQSSESNNVKVIDFFGFTSTTTQAQVFPDITACFPPGKELYIKLVLAGRYDMIYSRNPELFKSAFAASMIEYAKIESPLRIERLMVEPADKSNTLVQFTLLDKPSKTGNALNELPETGNDVIWSNLQKSIDEGKFKLTVNNDKGRQVAMAVSYGTEYQDPTSFNANYSALSDSSLYSPGEMAGLGFGMIILGLIIGFVGMKTTKRYQDRVPDIKMKQLNET